MLFGDQRVVKEDLANRGLGEWACDCCGRAVADVVRDGASNVDRLAVFDSVDEPGDDDGTCPGHDARRNRRPVHALKGREKLANLLAASIRTQNVHSRRFPVGRVVEAQQLQRGGRRVGGEGLQRRQRVCASVGNQDLVDELRAALGCEEWREDLFTERVDEGTFGGRTELQHQQVPEKRVRVLRAQRVDALLPQGRVVGAGIGLHVGEDARLENIGGRQGDAACVEHGKMRCAAW